MPDRAESRTFTEDVAALIGRVLMSAIFVWSGYFKLISPAGTQAYFAHVGVAFPWLAWVVAVVIELLGGLALLLGLQTRAVAALLGLWCIATAIAAHTNFTDPDMQIHFMKNVAMAGGFAVIAGFGGGRYTAARIFART
ncbi:MAG TPA: DoxX family protein [Stellaceae bacterium]|nr:DoxX family protein [Stellaceae bacterium]